MFHARFELLIFTATVDSGRAALQDAGRLGARWWSEMEFWARLWCIDEVKWFAGLDYSALAD